MKRFLCLALTVAMVLSFATISAFAADVTGVLSVTGDNGKVGDILTVSYTIKGADTVYSWQCVFSYNSAVIQPYDSEYADLITDSADAAYALTSSVFEQMSTDRRPKAYYGQTGASFANDTFSVYASCAGGAAGTTVPTAGEDYEVFTATFKRIAEGDIKVAYATDNTNKPIVETTSASGNVLTSTTLDYKAPGGDEPEDWKDTIASELPAGDDVKFPAAKGEDSTVNNDAKKVVIFAKNTSADTLVGTAAGTATYGITIGGMFYPGYLSVPAGASWSIILVDPNGELTGEYSASVKVGDETKALSNVSFQ